MRKYIHSIIGIIIVIRILLLWADTGETEGTHEYASEEIMFIKFGTADSCLGFRELLGPPGWDQEGPTAVAYAPNGDIYVVDKVKERIVQYDSNGHYLGQVCVVDTPILFMTTAGKQIRYTGLKGGDIEVDKYSNLYVAAGKVYIFDSNDELQVIIDNFGETGSTCVGGFLWSFGDGVMAGLSNFPDRLGREIEIFPDGHTGRIGLAIWRDYQGNTYEISDSIVIGVSKGEIPFDKYYQTIMKVDKKTKEKKILLRDLTKDHAYLHLFGLDNNGNLYFEGGKGLLKYDFEGNLLAEIPNQTVGSYMFGINKSYRVLENGAIMHVSYDSVGLHIIRLRLIED